ncbi:hypothetical protein VTO42DRAFT_5151 [Malbranchea cinnamomea]
MPTPPYRSIRALYTPTTVTVYQAYSPAIASAALDAQTFVPPFKRGRATWIKPSFTWMAYRSGYARKENQERILAVEISRAGFEWALRHAVLSHWDKTVYATEEEWTRRKEEACVRVQWDPERDVDINVEYRWRSLQVGLMGIAVDKYVEEWIVSITDVTDVMVRIGELVDKGEVDEARALLPEEKVYVLPDEIARSIGMTMPQAAVEETDGDEEKKE